MGCHKAEGCQTCDAEELFARGELRDRRDLLCLKFQVCTLTCIRGSTQTTPAAFDVCVSASPPSC